MQPELTPGSVAHAVLAVASAEAAACGHFIIVLDDRYDLCLRQKHARDTAIALTRRGLLRDGGRVPPYAGGQPARTFALTPAGEAVLDCLPVLTRELLAGVAA